MYWVFLLFIPFLGTSVPLWCLFFVSILTRFYFDVKAKQSFWEQKDVKHMKPKFFTGNMDFFRNKSFPDQVRETYNAFPEERYHGMYQFTKPVLILKDPDLIKLITVKEFDYFLNHSQSADPDVDPFWGKNLFARRDDQWRDMRATLSPSFTSSKMKILFALIEECALQFVQHFKNENGDLVELEMKDTFTRYTNDVIASCAFGLKCNSLKHRNNEFYETGKDIADFGGWRIFKFFIYGFNPTLYKLLRIKIIPPKLSNYFFKLIEDTVKVRKEKSIVRPDMIHLLLEAQKGRELEEDIDVSEGFSSVEEHDYTKNRKKQKITLDDIVSQAFVFFLAGFETVSTVLTFTFYELALNQDIQDRLREEIKSVEGKVTYEKLMKMKYLDMVLSESLRRWPPAIVTDRQCSKDFTMPPVKSGEKPLRLEKGTICWIPVFSIHNDPKLYSDPEKFDPERFSDENKHKINAGAYIPFGSGPRNCIGSRFALLESKIIIFYVLKNFQILRTKKTPVPVIFDKKSVNLLAEGGMFLGLKKI